MAIGGLSLGQPPPRKDLLGSLFTSCGARFPFGNRASAFILLAEQDRAGGSGFPAIVWYSKVMISVVAVDRSELSPFEMPDRFRTDIAYFMSPAGESGTPELAPSEYWIRLSDAKKWSEELVVTVVSPLDAAAKAELELTEQQELWLDWMIENQVERVRLEG